MFRNLALVAAIGLLAPASVRADVKPHSLCTDGMVLQQKMNVNLWGTADSGEKVTVSFRGRSASTTADGDGRWKVSLPSGAAGGPFALTIAGKNKLEYREVYVGEVWICSGQSNMQWSVSACDATDKKVAEESPPNKQLRLFYVQRVPTATPAADVQVQAVDGVNWTESNPKTVMPFSAAAYFFGRDLQAALKVPVGLIHTSWGGTRAEAWTSRAVLDAHSLYQSEAKPGEKLQPNIASVLYNGMIHPLLNYRIKGAIWYQGESNVGKASYYHELFTMMIQNWRKDWGQGDFPFYFVQLAPFLDVSKEPKESGWAELRESQLQTLRLPNTGMAVITDFGHERDIHPTPKRPVGERLSLAARAQTYGESIVYTGPVYRSLKIDGNKAVVTFTQPGRSRDAQVADGSRVVEPRRRGLLGRIFGRRSTYSTPMTGEPPLATGFLVAKEMVPTDGRPNNKTGTVGYGWRVKEGAGAAELTGFAVCGADKKFHNAKAEIVGNTVVVTSDAVANPVAVRYGWADHPICNLFNREGLPASPFRTDDYPGVSKK